MEIIGLWNSGDAYGPFYFNRLSIFFYLYQKEIYLDFNGKFFREENIFIKKDNIIMPILDRPIEDRKFFFREGPCMPDRSMRSFPYHVPSRNMQLIPARKEPIRFSLVDNNFFIIERDLYALKNRLPQFTKDS
jgi:hypothetical protein